MLQAVATATTPNMIAVTTWNQRSVSCWRVNGCFSSPMDTGEGFWIGSSFCSSLLLLIFHEFAQRQIAPSSGIVLRLYINHELRHKGEADLLQDFSQGASSPGLARKRACVLKAWRVFVRLQAHKN